MLVNTSFYKYSLWTVGVILCIYILKYVKNHVRFLCLLFQLPRPKLHPIFAHLHLLVVDNETIFKNLRTWGQKFYPVYSLVSPPTGCINIVGPEDIEAVTATLKHSSKGPIYDLTRQWLQDGLLTSAGAKWQQRRKLLTPAFHFTILQQFIGIFYQESKNLVKQLESAVGKEYIDVVPPITNFALCSISETSMGSSIDLNNKLDKQYKNAILKIGQCFLHRLTRPWIYLNFIYYLTPAGWNELKLVKILHNYSNTIIEKKIIEDKKNEGNGEINRNIKKKRMAMLDLLIHAKNNELIDIHGIREEVDTFMFEGHDTISMALSFALMTLAMHPKVQDQIVQEINDLWPDPNQEPTYQLLNDLKYTEMCIKECLRLYPSVPFISRVLDEDLITSQGQKVAAGSTANIHIFDLHRQASIYPDPEKFDPDRFLPENIQKRHPFAYIPFSAGPRNCIGQKFAMLEAKTALCTILRNFVIEPIDTPETIHLIADIVLRPRDGIKVKFYKRNNLIL